MTNQTDAVFFSSYNQTVTPIALILKIISQKKAQTIAFNFSEIYEFSKTVFSKTLNKTVTDTLI